MENKLFEKKNGGSRTEKVRERVEWLRKIGMSPRNIKKSGLDKPVDDLTFQVLINEVTRKQGQCFTDS